MLTEQETQELEARLDSRYRRRLEQDFSYFMEEAWKVLQPGRLLVWSWHYNYIAEYIKLIFAGDIRRAIFNVPPRTLKSIQITIMAAAWKWVTDPGHNFFFGSYNKDLSTEHSVARRSLMESQWYRGLWGHRWQFASDQNVKNQYKNTANGQMIATSVGASAMGKGGDTLVLDDSMSPDQVMSEAERAATFDWHDQTWSSRLNDPAHGAMLLVEQRTSSDDLTSYLLRTYPNEYTHVVIPLEQEEPQDYIFPISKKVVHRPKGDILQPERFTPEVVASKKRKNRVFMAQSQQKPLPVGGVIWDRKWWRFYRNAPARFDQVIQSWDMSFKETSDSSYVVGLVIGRIGADKYVLDSVWKQMNFPASQQAVKTLSAKWPQCTRKLIEDKANGPAILSSLKNQVPGLIAVEPQGSKPARGEAASADAESGNIYLPENAEWVHDAIDECERFPKEPNDWPDALAQAINWFRMQSHGMVDFYGKYAEAVKAEKEALEAKRIKPAESKPRVWSDAIRTIGMGISANVTDLQELRDWIAFLKDIGDGERLLFAEQELERTENTCS